MRLPALAFVLTSAAFATCPLASAADYPFTGTFSIVFNGSPPGNLEARCALSFLEQKPDGHWAAYHVDHKAFAQSGSISYLQISNGRCSYEAATKVEACGTDVDKSFKDNEGIVITDVITTLDASKVVTRSFETDAKLKQALAGKTVDQDGMMIEYYRCPQEAALLTSRIGPNFTTLTEEELQKLRDPPAEILADAFVQALVQALKAK